MSKNITQKTKKRNWGAVIYPESLPKDWLKILADTGLQIAISPLHDKDLEADEKTQKKAHYHIILVYPGPTTYNAVLTITKKLNAPAPIPLEAVRGYYRYLTHKDNPEKYQYDEKEIKCLNGFSILDFVELTKSEVAKIKKILIDEIKKNDICEYSDFLDYVAESLSENEFDVASSHTILFNNYITSRRHKKETIKQKRMTSAEIDELSRQALDSQKSE